MDSVINMERSVTHLLDGFGLSKRICPQCGLEMMEVNRSNEDGWLFVWYQCPDVKCDGQWLQKYPQMLAENVLA